MIRKLVSSAALVGIAAVSLSACGGGDTAAGCRDAIRVVVNADAAATANPADMARIDAACDGIPREQANMILAAETLKAVGDVFASFGQGR